MAESVSTAGQRWLRRRVRVYAAFDHFKQHAPIAEGVVVGYAPHPTIVVRSEDGRQSDWQVTLPITVLEENAEIPATQEFLTREDLRRIREALSAAPTEVNERLIDKITRMMGDD